MTPLVLIVGFLGSGKTTLLKKLLPRLTARSLQPCVIINDYQNAKVDAEQLRGQVGEIAAISGDCVCCGSWEDLVQQLKSVRHEPGKLVIVETNGTTDSELLIENLSLNPNLYAYTLPVQISVVDARRWQKRFWNNPLEVDQARTASYLFVSRCDEVDPERLAKVEQSLAKTLSAARVGVEDFAAQLEAVAKEVQDLPPRHSIEQPGHGHKHHDHEDKHHHFASMEVPLPERVSRKSFDSFLRNLPADVIRAKGIVRFSEAPSESHIFQRVDGFETPYFFPLQPDAQITTPLVLFIGPQLPEAELQEAVSKLNEAW